MTGGALRLIAVSVALALNALIGGFFLQGLIPGVIGIYQRGYGRFNAVIAYILVPAFLLLVTVGLPILLCLIGKTRAALIVGFGSLPLLWLPYFALLVMTLAI
jgi:hypothetical protein